MPYQTEHVQQQISSQEVLSWKTEVSSSKTPALFFFLKKKKLLNIRQNTHKHPLELQTVSDSLHPGWNAAI